MHPNQATVRRTPTATAAGLWEGDWGQFPLWIEAQNRTVIEMTTTSEHQLPRWYLVVVFAHFFFQAGVVDGETIHIKGGTVINADRKFRADVLVVGGKIEAVGAIPKSVIPDITIDAEDKLVLPGGIDPHTHLDMPFMGLVSCDDFLSGQLAALAGGTTMHIDFALPVKHNLIEGFKKWKEKAKDSVMDYAFHMAVTKWSFQVERDMKVLVEQFGINSFKFFMAYKGALMISDEEMLKCLQKCKQLGAIAQVHAENGDGIEFQQKMVIQSGILGPEGHALSRPPYLEGEATSRAIRLSRLVNTPLYVVHVMSEDALVEIEAARALGQRVVGEAVTSGLSLDESLMWNPDFHIAAQAVMSPPLRKEKDRQALRHALASNILSLVGTDHAVFNSTQKAAGLPPESDFRSIPNGVNGIEERMHIVWHEMVNSGMITQTDFVKITSTEAAQIFNLYPQKGVISPGADADIIIFDPEQEHVISAKRHHSRSDMNVYEGKLVKGKVVVTISGGRVVWKDGIFNVTPGTGRYLHLPPFGPLFEGLDLRENWADRFRKAPLRRFFKWQGRKVEL